MTELINARHVNMRRAGGGNYESVSDYFDGIEVSEQVPRHNWTVTLNDADNAPVPSTVLTGMIALGVGTRNGDNGVVCGELAGALGTASAATLADAYGDTLNKAAVADKATGDPIRTAGLTDATHNNRLVFGLWHAANGTLDGAGIGPAGTENVQLSLCYTAPDGTITPYAHTGDVMFGVPRARELRQLPAIRLASGGRAHDVFAEPEAGGAGSLAVERRDLVVAAAVASGDTITLSTGDAVTAGAGALNVDVAPRADTITLPAAADFNDPDFGWAVFVNGIQVTNGVHVQVAGPDALTVNLDLDPEDRISIRRTSVGDAAAVVPVAGVDLESISVLSNGTNAGVRQLVLRDTAGAIIPATYEAGDSVFNAAAVADVSDYQDGVYDSGGQSGVSSSIVTATITGGSAEVGSIEFAVTADAEVSFSVVSNTPLTANLALGVTLPAGDAGQGVLRVIDLTTLGWTPADGDRPTGDDPSVVSAAPASAALTVAATAPSVPADLSAGNAFTWDLSAAFTGGTAPITYAAGMGLTPNFDAVDSPPAAASYGPFSLDTATGVLTGQFTRTSPGGTEFRITATDNGGASVSTTITV